MKKFIYALGLLTSAITMSGCVGSIGEDDFSCPNIKKGGVCGGPRDVYELTNNRVNLEGLSEKELEAYYDRKHKQENPGHAHDANSDNLALQEVPTQQGDTVYKPRSNSQQRPGAYETAQAIPQTRFEKNQTDSYQQWPSNGEPMAPEPMAVLEPAQVMRVLVTAYTDQNGYANMPGYVYVEVTPRQWSFGEAANQRPSRVVPLKLREKTQQQLRQRRQKSQGVDAMEVINPMNRNK